jgi:glycogen synthase
MSAQGIALLTNEYPPSPCGGIGIYTQTLARALCKKGWKVRVIGMYPRTDPGLCYEVDEGVEVWRLKQPQIDWGGIKARMRVCRRVTEWCRKGWINLVEAPDAEGWTAFWPKIPAAVVVRVHGSATYFSREMNRPKTLDSRIRFALERAALRRADFWSTTSRYCGDKTRDLFGLRPYDALLYNGVTIKPRLPAIQRNKNMVVFTGTVTEKKGIKQLIRAWERVKSSVPDAELNVLGKHLRPLSELTSGASAGVLASIHFRGHQSSGEVRRYLESARVAVFPSFVEAFALAPMEAMASGCPTIYSTRTSGPELIESGRNGILVDPARTDELANAIISVLKDDELAERLGDAGRRTISDRFNLDAILPEYERFYQHCMSAFRNRKVRPPMPLRGEYFL